MTATGVLIGVLVIGLAFTLGLYAMVRSEHDQCDEISREEAERVSRRGISDDR